MNTIAVEQFKKNNPHFSVFLGIPAFGGNLKSGFVQSLLKLQAMFYQLNIPHDYCFMAGESLICRGRNAIVSKFINSGHSHLLFLDTDLVFNPGAILSMIIQDFDIVGLSYPKKSLNWQKVRWLIEEKKPLHGRLCDMNFNPYLLGENGDKTMTKGRYMRAKDIPTGAMLINKNVFFSLMRKHPELRYTNNVSGYDANLCYDFFQVGVCPESRIYLSEDYYFCKIAADSGYELWVDYKTPLGHIGEYEFVGSIENEFDGLIKFNKDLIEVNLNR